MRNGSDGQINLENDIYWETILYNRRQFESDSINYARTTGVNWDYPSQTGMNSYPLYYTSLYTIFRFWKFK